MAYILYGIRIPYFEGSKYFDHVEELGNYFVPDLVEEYGKDWVCSTDDEFHITKDGNFEFAFMMDLDRDGYLYIASYLESVDDRGHCIRVDPKSDREIFKKLRDAFPLIKYEVDCFYLLTR